MDKRNKKPSRFLILPIVLILFVVPLIVHMKNFIVSESAFHFWKGIKEDSDFFSYYKMVWFLIFTGFAILALYIKLFMDKYKIKKTYIYIPMGIYSLLVVLSSLMSKAQDVVYNGFPSRFEGMFVILGYMVILFIVINILEDENQLKILLRGLFLSSLIIGVIGIFQYLNMDFFQTDFGKKLMLPLSEWSRSTGLNFQLGARAVYGTLYHTNYVGSFMAMMLPLSLAFFIFLKDKNQRILFGALSVIMFLNLMASHSRAGIAGAIIAVVILVVFGRKVIVKNWVYSIGLVCVLIVVALGANAVTKGDITSKIGTLTNDSAPSPTATVGIKDITVVKDLLKFTDANGILNFRLVNGTISVTDENNNKVPFNYDKKLTKITFSQPKYAPYVIGITTIKDGTIIMVQRSTLKVNFVVTSEGFKLYDNRGQILDINPIQRWGFKGYENLGSARGYIWSRAIPLLKNTIILGYGPDTFAIHFPQNDYMGKLLAYGDTGIVVDKPHNIYLQAAINTGVISLLALLALFIMYFISSIRLYIGRKFENIYEICGLGILTAVCGYLISGMFNDSTVSVSPVFWILLGIGISINLKLSQNKSY